MKQIEEASISVGRTAIGGLDKICIRIETDGLQFIVRMTPEAFALALTSMNVPCTVHMNLKGA